jgi:hypothetical protein
MKCTTRDGRSASIVLLALAIRASCALGQQVEGRVYDAENGAPVGLAGVFLLDRDRDVVVRSLADVEGRFALKAPRGGEYILVAQRLGYFENETPLLALDEGGAYGVDFELRPEPIRLDPLRVSVRNADLEDYLSREIGENPNGVFGYRVIQGLVLEEAKARAEDNTDLLRRLFVPVHHGREVCLGWGRFGPRSSPTALDGTVDPSWRPSSEGEPDTNFPCGRLYVNGYRCPAELLETLDPDLIGVVVTLGGDVHLYRRDFDWTFRPGSGGGAC